MRHVGRICGALIAALWMGHVVFAATTAAQEVKQLKLTDKQVQGFIASQKDLAAIAGKIQAAGDKPDASLQGELESLATTLTLPVQPFVVPEFRFHAHLERLFGVPTPARFATLARRYGYVPSPAHVDGHEPSVLVSDQATTPATPTPPQAPRPQATMDLGSGQLAHGDAAQVQVSVSMPPPFAP